MASVSSALSVVEQNFSMLFWRVQFKLFTTVCQVFSEFVENVLDKNLEIWYYASDPFGGGWNSLTGGEPRWSFNQGIVVRVKKEQCLGYLRVANHRAF